MNKRNSISSRDVAKEAGVSQATVSYVLNDVKNIRIKPETREAVLNAVKKLNYHPNHIARGMKLRKSMSIGVVTDRSLTNHNFMRTLEGIKDGIQQYNYTITLMFNVHEEASDLEYIKHYNTNRIDGIIFAFTYPDKSSIDLLLEKEIPFILVNAHSIERDVMEVNTDHIIHIGEAIRHFKRRNIFDVGYIGLKGRSPANIKAKIFKDEIQKNGLITETNNMKLVEHDDESVIKGIKELLVQEKRPSALVAGTPRLSLLTVKCANQLNIKIPEELSIIAIGSSNFYNVTQPSISAVELPLYDMGFYAAEKLLEKVNGKEPEKNTVLPSKLILRESS